MCSAVSLSFFCLLSIVSLGFTQAFKLNEDLRKWSNVLLDLNSEDRLTIRDGHFSYKGEKVFLSGMNLAWYEKGNDFGNGRYRNVSGPVFKQWLAEIAEAGGNIVSVWIHAEAEYTPEFDSKGFVRGTDAKGTMIDDMRAFLDEAHKNKLFVNFLLWSTAFISDEYYWRIFMDDDKLQSYINNALKPMVKALAGHPALASWEILMEPEGATILNLTSSNPCYDTTNIDTSAGWTIYKVPMENLLKFINWQAAAIRSIDPAALITTSSLSEMSETDAFPKSRDHYSDECLVSAGGRLLGTLDFHNMHTAAVNHVFAPTAPFKVSASVYNSTKPIVIGHVRVRLAEEFTSIQDLFEWAYFNGYGGALGFQYNGEGIYSDPPKTQLPGLSALIRAQTKEIGLIRWEK